MISGMPCRWDRVCTTWLRTPEHSQLGQPSIVAVFEMRHRHQNSSNPCSFGSGAAQRGRSAKGHNASIILGHTVFVVSASRRDRGCAIAPSIPTGTNVGVPTLAAWRIKRLCDRGGKRATAQLGGPAFANLMGR